METQNKIAAAATHDKLELWNMERIEHWEDVERFQAEHGGFLPWDIICDDCQKAKATVILASDISKQERRPAFCGACTVKRIKK